jgi:2-polyprenyl-6-methoxyphenol hydroxylase-like FAD-dependent oxidoreductase
MLGVVHTFGEQRSALVRRGDRLYKNGGALQGVRVGPAEESAGVDVKLSDGQPLRADYLVGCDGERSLIRKAAGIGFPGWDPTTSSLVAEVEMDGEPEWGIRRDDKGIHSLGRLEDGERVRVVVREQHAGHAGEATLCDLRRVLISRIRGPITRSTVPPGFPGSPI